uniref:Rieske-type oxygenase n=1 Tax=Rhodococcus erythropolis TaxID=1833 RepID=O69348_RHOER|nr:orf12 [Rhodococcus erythropolis]
MGGNLAHGTVKGDSIACPFHDWRWGGNGKCTAIPYARRVPPLAKTRAWITLEKNGQLFVWHDPQGNPPPAEVTIPDIEGFGSDEWSDWSWNTLTIEGSHCREIVDNVVDMAHFFYVHYSFPKYFKNIFEGHVASQYMESVGREDVISGTNYGDPNAVLRSDASYFGPSYMIDWIKSEANGQIIETVLINCHYPISNNAFVLQYGAMVKKLPGMDDEATAAMAAQFTEGVEMGFLQDVEIWKNKAPIDKPAALGGGRPGLPVAALVQPVLHRCRERHGRHDEALRIRDRHYPRSGELEAEVAENVAARDAQALETTS